MEQFFYGVLDILGSAKKTLTLAIVGVFLLLVLKSGSGHEDPHNLLSGLIPSIYTLFGGFIKLLTCLFLGWSGVLAYKGRF